MKVLLISSTLYREDSVVFFLAFVVNSSNIAILVLIFIIQPTCMCETTLSMPNISAICLPVFIYRPNAQVFFFFETSEINKLSLIVYVCTLDH